MTRQPLETLQVEGSGVDNPNTSNPERERSDGQSNAPLAPSETVENNHLLRAALDYLRQGWRPIPIQPGKKKPLISWKEFQQRPPTVDEVRDWWRQWPDANVGIVTGGGTNLVVIDTDSDKGEEALLDLTGRLERTPTSKTGKGRHRLFAQSIPPVGNGVKLLVDVDIRGEGGYIVAPPSIHSSGVEYQWEEGLGPDTPLSPLPEAILALLTEESSDPRTNTSAMRPRERTRERITPKRITEGVEMGERNVTMTRYVGRLLGKGLPADEVLTVCLAVNQRDFRPPLEENEVANIVDSVATREAARRTRRLTKRESRESDPQEQEGIICLAGVQAEQVTWLWYPYLPSGKLTLIDGDPEVGKSSVTLDFAARVSCGRPFPDSADRPPAAVILLGDEDGLADTVKPRLEAMGADLDRIHAIKGVPLPDGSLAPIRFPDGIQYLREKIDLHGARLVVIDAITSFMSGNHWADHEVRPILTALAQLAAETGTAIVLVRHLNKKEGMSAKYRGGGSVAFTAVPRVVLLIGADPESPERRVMAKVKNNLARTVPSRRFDLESYGNSAHRVSWSGTVECTADDLVQPSTGRRRTKLEAAKDFIRDQLEAGELATNELERRALSEGITLRTLDRARHELGIVSQKSGGAGTPWMLSLSDNALDETEPLAVLSGDVPLSYLTGSLDELDANAANGVIHHAQYDHESVEERAAMYEFDAGLDRSQAEELAKQASAGGSEQ